MSLLRNSKTLACLLLAARNTESSVFIKTSSLHSAAFITICTDSYKSFSSTGSYILPKASYNCYSAVYVPQRSFASSNPDNAKSNLPSAKDCDDALESVEDLRERFTKLKRPPTVRTWSEAMRDIVISLGNGTLAFLKFCISVPSRLHSFIMMPADEWDATKARWKKAISHEAHHYWVGTKLLAADVRIASRLALKSARGKHLTRRERRQLTRTTADLFRIVPFVIIVAIPFMELALPVLLKLFPKLLPSQYEDKLKKEEELKRRLASRLELARFLQDTMGEMAKHIKSRSQKSEIYSSADDLYHFVDKVRRGEPVENSDILRFAQLFNDELTLDHLQRVQLVTLCQFVGISHFGTDSYLRSQLRAHLQAIKADDYEIEKEGLENLTQDELRSACRARGMRAPYGEGAMNAMRRQLQDWLDLSLHRGLPSSLLLLSRAFTITGKILDVADKKEMTYKSLKDTISSIPTDLVVNVQFDRLGPKDNQERLEFIQREEELIRQEEKTEKEARAGKPEIAGYTSEEAAARKEAIEAISAEEASLAEAEKEERLRAIMAALLDLASGSGVARERAQFMELVKKEVKRLGQDIVQETGGTRSLVFSSRGLEVTGASDEGQADGHEGPPRSLSERVGKMLERIELDLDLTEGIIGKKMKMLDADGDGVIEQHELEEALRFLRSQLSPQELADLLTKLSVVTTLAGKQGIQVSDLLKQATKDEEGAKAKAST